MMMFSVPCVQTYICVFLLFGFSSGQDFINKEGALVRKLMNASAYDPRVRPVSNYNDTLSVGFSVSILRINELNERTEVLDLTVWLHFWWTDLRLKWNAVDAGVRSLRIPVKSIWTPDIVPYNNFDQDLTVGESLAVLSSDGTVTWIPPARLRTFCSVDMRNFPFDKQTCTLRFGSWTYDATLINMTQTSVSLGPYNMNKEWNILKTSSNIKLQKYDCCPEVYQTSQININLVRRDNYLSAVFVLPAVLVALLVPLQCLIPPTSEEKVSLGGALFISMVLLSSALNQALPSSHVTSPYISTYYSITMVWIALSVAAGAFIKHIASAKYTRKEIPNIIRQIVLPFFKKIFFMDDEPFYTPTELEALSMRGIDLGLEVNSSTQAKATTQVSGKLEKDVNEILSHVNSITVIQRLGESRVKNSNEWYQLAVAFDRLVCALFVFTVVVYSLAILA